MRIKRKATRLKSTVLAPFNYSIGRVYHHRKQYSLAAIFYAKAIRGGKAKNPEVYYRYSNALRLKNKNKTKNNKLAGLSASQARLVKKHLGKATSEGHKNPKYYTEYAALMIELEEYEIAEEALMNALSLRPENFEIKMSVARFLISRRNWWQAKDLLLEDFLSGQESPESLQLLGRAAFEMKDYKLSAKIYALIGESEVSSGDKAEAFYMCGLSLDFLDKKSKATAMYKKAIELDDIYDALRLGNGSIYQNYKLWSLAKEAYISTLEGSVSEVVKAEILFRIGQCSKNLYEEEAAVKYMEESLAIDARWAERHYRLGLLCSRLGLYDKAIYYLTQAKNRKPKSTPAIFYELGFALNKKGESKQTALLFEEFKHSKPAYSKKKKKKKRMQEVYLNYRENIPLDEKLILYEAFHGTSITCNPYAIFNKIIKDDKFKDYKHIWVVNDMEKIPAKIMGMHNVYFVPRTSMIYQYYVAKAKWLINNGTFYDFFIRRDEQYYLNTWHGTPWKTLGRDMTHWVFEMANTQRNFLQSTHMISSNKFTSNILIGSYDIKGIYKGSLAEVGYPRIDLTVNMNEREKKDIKHRLGIKNEQKVVFYAPTWRTQSGKPTFDVKRVESTLKKLLQQNYHVIYRGHRLTPDNDVSSIIDKSSIPDDISTNEILAITDVLVTDYSSVYIDFLVTNRPIVFYIYDKNDFEADRGFYYGVKELPGEVVQDEDQLVHKLRTLTEGRVTLHPRYKAAKNKYSKHEDGDAAERTIKYFFDNDRTYVDNEVNKIPPDTVQVLVQGGRFKSSGITSTLLNLEKMLSKDNIQPIITVDSRAIVKDKQGLKHLEGITKRAQVISRCGDVNKSVYESKVVKSFYRNKRFVNPKHRSEFANVYRREYRRIFGDFKFDHAIDYVGHSVVWTPVIAFNKLKNDAGLKTILLHNDIQGEIDKKYPNQESMVTLYKEFDNIASVSRATSDVNLKKLANKHSIPKSKFIYIDNIQNPEDVLSRAEEEIKSKKIRKILQNDSKTITFINIGRLSIEKDHEKLIYAFQSVHSKFPNTQLLIVGDGPLRLKLELLISKLNLQKRVYILGYQSNPFPILKRSDCFILSSLHEGQPTVLYEALILNKPIIATDIPANKGVLKNKYGRIVSGRDPKGLTEGMTDYINGKVNNEEFDIYKYQEEALTMFKNKVLKM